MRDSKKQNVRYFPDHEPLFLGGVGFLKVETNIPPTANESHNEHPANH